MTTILCSNFHPTQLPGGLIRLEITEAPPDPKEDKMSVKDIASLIGKSSKVVDKLSRRQHNPLPLIRGKGHRPYTFRARLNDWLTGSPNPAASIQSLFATV